ncbi:MAG: thioredoxin fold domain-containing protein [Burkholderiales bacterium]|nr:thioredoxin fold domain-containing protein [Burkholderiales bacterium]
MNSGDTGADGARRAVVVLGALAALGFAPAPLAQARPGAPGKGESYTLPSWFKASLLEFPDEVADARKRGRHVMVFLHLDDCPYCAKMLRESFTSGEIRAYMERHFDVVAVNVRGAQETKWIDGATYTEQTLARHLKVRGTPTIVFLGMEAGVALRLDGYKDPKTLRRALGYVQSRRYRDGPFSAYPAGRDERARHGVDARRG